MNRFSATVALLLMPIALCGASHAADTSSVPEGPYLGQTPPGMTAKPFASGIVNTEEWGDAGGFSQDMTKFYVTRWRHSRDAEVPDSVIFKQVGSEWQKVLMPDEERKLFESPDGKTLHFKDKYKERTADGWSEMKSLGPAFEAIQIMTLKASAKGTLVLDERGTREGVSILRYSRRVDGKWEDPKSLPIEINTGIWNAHPFIAPDESYIMWDGERQIGYGESDLYISFRQKDGSWGEAINMGDKVNTAAEEGGPRVTPDGKYLFFNRMVPKAGSGEERQSDLFWIDARIIEELRPQE